jgi:hypothetical protein
VQLHLTVFFAITEKSPDCHARPHPPLCKDTVGRHEVAGFKFDGMSVPHNVAGFVIRHEKHVYPCFGFGKPSLETPETMVLEPPEQLDKRLVPAVAFVLAGREA